MATVLNTTFAGYRELVTKFRGSRCDVCGETVPAQTTVLYNSLTRTLRHISCHHDHAANLLEIWEADVTTTDDETGENVTERLVIRLTTMRRESGMPRGVHLIHHLDSISTETPLAEIRQRFAHIAPVRGHYS